MNRVEVASLMCVAILAPASFARPDLAECIAGIKRFEKRYERMSATIDIQRFRLKSFDGAKDTTPPDGLFQEEKIEYWRDGEKARKLETSKHRSRMDGQLKEFTTCSECIATQEIRIIVGRDPQTGLFEESNINARIADAKFSPVRDLNGGIDAFILDGRMDFMGPALSDRLNVANVKIQEDLVRDQRAVRLEFEDGWGNMSVWLDPVRDYHPIRVTQQKSPRHWIRPDVRMEQVPDNPRYGKLSSIDYEINIAKLKKFDGQWFAMELEVRGKYVGSETKEAEDKVCVRMTDISVDPNTRGNQFKLATNVPEGTWVVVNNQLSPRYEWREGRVVRVGNR